MNSSMKLINGVLRKKNIIPIQS